MRLTRPDIFLCLFFSLWLFCSCESSRQEEKGGDPPQDQPAVISDEQTTPPHKNLISRLFLPAPTPYCEPLQFFFPHGQHGPLQIMGDSIVRAASWTRGDGVEFFNKDTLEYEGGVLSAGYVSDTAVYGNCIYIATGYSVQVVRRLPENEPEILENILLNFPGGGTDRLALDDGKLYVQTVGGLRVYQIQPDGRLLYLKNYPELTGLSAFAVAKGIIHYVQKATPRIRFQLFPDGKKDSEMYPKAITALLPVGQSDKLYYISGGVLMDEKRTPLTPPVAFFRRHGAGGYMIAAKDGTLFFINDCGEIKTGTHMFTERDARSAVLEKDFYWLKGHYLHGNGKKMPIIQNEGPVCYVKPFVYSVQRCGNTYLLYGSNTKLRQDRSYDVLLEWDAVSKKQFYYDIVMPPYSFFRTGKYLLAPEAVLDISEPESPKVAAKIDGAAACIAEDEDNRIWLAQGDKLTVLDGSALPEIKILTEYKTGRWTEIAVDGNLLISNDRNGFTVYDVSDIANPKKLSRMKLKGNFYKMAYREKHLYLAPYGGDAPLKIVSLVKPERPRIAGIVNRFKGKNILGIQIYKNSLYVASGREIVRFILHEPHRPVGDCHWIGPDKAMQSYNYMDVCDGVLVGKKYPRFDVWRLDE